MATYTFTTLTDPLANTFSSSTHTYLPSVLGFPGSGTFVSDISGTGQIVGAYFGQTNQTMPHGLLYNSGTYTTLNDPLATSFGGTAALGVNDTGQVVGVYNNATAPFSDDAHGFLYSGGTYTTISGPAGSQFSYAFGINNSGQVVGTSVVNFAFFSGFLFSGGTYTVINDPLATGSITVALDINDSGQIVGTYVDGNNKIHGFLYNGGTYTTIDDPLGANGTVAKGINNASQIVGLYIDSNNLEHGFLYSGGTYTTIDDPLGARGSAAMGINNAGQIVGSYFDSTNTGHGFLASSGQTTITAQVVQNDYLGITRTALPLDQATTVANAINAGTQTETQYVSGLLSQVANTTIPAVAVEATMYGATGTSAEITSLTTNFLPAQVANATKFGLNAQVYSCEAVGLVFAFGNENGSTAFSNNFGPSNSAMPNTTAGDAAFAAAASSAIFGSASTANLVNVMTGFVTFWKGFFAANGVPGATTAAQFDLAARGTAWGDMVGVAIANNLGPLNGQSINFLEDAAQGTAVYGASLVGQPVHQPFQG